MRTIIAGSRKITDFKVLVEAIEAAALFEGIVPTSTLSGGAGGVDRLGERWAAEQGLACRLCPPDWKQGPTAGFARNYTMAQGADALIAVWDGSSAGTKHMIQLARKYGLLVYVHEVT
jgi:hypothetical protein